MGLVSVSLLLYFIGICNIMKVTEPQPEKAFIRVSTTSLLRYSTGPIWRLKVANIEVKIYESEQLGR